jgi:hypothetical protein
MDARIRPRFQAGTHFPKVLCSHLRLVESGRAFPDVIAELRTTTPRKKAPIGRRRGRRIDFQSEEPPSLLSTAYDTSPPVLDPVLDEKIETAGLKTDIGSTLPASWQRKKRGRVERP